MIFYENLCNYCMHCCVSSQFCTGSGSGSSLNLNKYQKLKKSHQKIKVIFWWLVDICSLSGSHGVKKVSDSLDPDPEHWLYRATSYTWPCCLVICKTWLVRCMPLYSSVHYRHFLQGTREQHCHVYLVRVVC